jgi:hypothetical protein
MLYTTQDDMPNKNKLILGTSSYWIINLIYKSYIYELYFQSLLLTSIMIISPLFWYYYKINSIYHKLDNYLSILMLSSVIIQHYLTISYFDLLRQRYKGFSRFPNLIKNNHVHLKINDIYLIYNKNKK